MKTRLFLIRMVALMAVASLSFVVSCADDEPEFGQEAAYAAEESSIDAYYADADDMAGIAMAESEETEGEKLSEGASEVEVNDDRFCNTITVILDNLSSSTFPIGDITIDFGTGCTDSQRNTRKGKIKIHFEGRKFRPGSVVSITFENYEIIGVRQKGVKLNGVRTLTYLQASTVDKPNYQVELENGSIEWDGYVATREHCFISTWERGVILVPSDDVLKTSQCADADEAAIGVNRSGVYYRMFIEEELVYNRGCSMAVSGIKTWVEVSTGKEIIIDYGSGTCDSDIAITVDGNIHTVN